MKALIEIFSRYGVWGLLKLAVYVLYTKMVAPNAKVFRLPIEIRGLKNIKFGDHMVTGRYCRFEAIPGQGRLTSTVLSFGRNVQVNDLVHIVANESVAIGNDVLIASKVFISDCSHGGFAGGDDMAPSVPPANRPLVSAPVVIEDRVWLGDGVVVLPGVRIGAGSIVGANAVVTKNIPENCVAAGVPAKVIRKYSSTSRQWE